MTRPALWIASSLRSWEWRRSSPSLYWKSFSALTKVP